MDRSGYLVELGCVIRKLQSLSCEECSMKSYLVAVAMFILAFGHQACVAAADGQKPNNEKKRAQTTCWPGEPEIQNRSVGKRRPTRLPPELAHATTRRSVMLLKLCVSETGGVARVLVLESSGNADVDNYYTKELSTWTLTPVERERRKVRSVVSVAVTLYLK